MNHFLNHPIRKALAVFAAGCAFAVATVASAGAQVEDFTKSMGFDQNIGTRVPMDAVFKDEQGKTIKFGSLFQKRPIILVPIFYNCRSGCELVTDSLLKALASMTKNYKVPVEHSWSGFVGKDFDVVVLSIDPRETPALALAKKNLMVDAYHQPGTESGWHMLTGSLDNIHRVTDAVGFRYYFNPKTDVIRHPTGIVFLSPSGLVSSYILGTDYAPSVLDSDAVVASRNQLGQKTEKILFGCILLDPATGSRRLIIENVVRIACLATLLILVCSIVNMSLKNRRDPLGGNRPLSSS